MTEQMGRPPSGDDDDTTGTGASGGGGEGASAPTATPPRPPRSPRSRLIPTIVVLVVIIAGIAYGAQVWTELLWYDSVGFQNVFTTRLWTQVGLFAVGAVLAGGLAFVAMSFAYRQRPVYAPVSLEQQNLERYRDALEPVRRLVFIGVPIALGLFAGTAAAGQWQNFLLWRNAQTFGVDDPHFGMDVGFFVFHLPWLSFLVSFLTMVLALALIANLVVHYIYGGIQLQGAGDRTTREARIQLSIIAALLVLTRAVAFWLERYQLSVSQGTGYDLTGMMYTDVNAVLPTRGILAVAALICAAMFVATIWSKNWRLPIIGLAGLIVVALLVGGLYPRVIQQLRVTPSEQALQEPYIQRNIDATLAAYDLDDAEVQPYTAETDVTAGQLRDDAETIPGIRIVDPAIVSPTFRQLQGVRGYYQFSDALDVDRYEIQGEIRDAVVAVRELNLEGIPDGQRNWVNDATVYTHGFGFVAAYGNQRSEGGTPIFFERNIPPAGELPEFEPRIYFGESSPQYSIVGAPEGATPRELDYPSGEADGTGEVRNTYDGEGGVDVGTLPRRLAYALKYREINILLSENVNSESVILDHRNPRERVERVAPWLRLDGNPYPAVVDGRVLWIVDGYTTSANYPYSSLEALEGATTDTLTTQAGNIQRIGEGEINYVRNSVKATVDAYDGTVTLYEWHDEGEEPEPLLRAWSQAFGTTVQPMESIDGELMSHLRYPEDLFKIQREVMSRYHVDTANAFFGGQDFWRVPEDPTVSTDAQNPTAPPVPPYYLSVAMPGQEEPAFSLTTTYVPRGTDRQNLTGYMAVDADAGSEDGVRREGYGQLRVLELPRDSTVRGPGQFQNDINTSNETSEAFTTTLAQFLNLNQQQDSTVEYGNLLTLPVGGGMLYVEPVYVRASAGTAYPLQRLVVVAFGDQLAWSDTLDSALNELFGGDSGASAGDEGSGADTPIDPGEPVDPEGGEPTEEPTDGDTATTTPPAPEDTAPPEDVDAAIAEVQSAYQEGQDAFQAGDWEAYAAAQDRLDAAIQDLVELQPDGGSVDISPGEDTEETSAP